MKKTVRISDVTIGAGLPKICIPLVSAGPDELAAQLQALEQAPFDMVEFRADHFANWQDRTALKDALAMVRSAVKEAPVLFTFRTKEEGGESEIDPQDYLGLNRWAASLTEENLVDLVDIELFTLRKAQPARPLQAAFVQSLQVRGAVVIGSCHDFEKTPSVGEMVERLVQMQRLGMDITKLAVMPRCDADVIRLLDASVQMKETFGDRPCVTMSMGKTGVISRVCGSLTGSAITFATAGAASAPGQIPAADLKSMLQIL